MEQDDEHTEHDEYPFIDPQARPWSLPPGAQFSMSLLNTQEEIRRRLVSFVADFYHLDEEERSRRIAQIDTQLVGHVHVFRGLARNRGMETEFLEEIRGITTRIPPGDDDAFYEGFVAAAHAVLAAAQRWQERLGLLIGLETPQVNVTDVELDRILDDARETFVAMLLDEGTVESNDAVLYVGKEPITVRQWVQLRPMLDAGEEEDN
jgi:hypothetical protein